MKIILIAFALLTSGCAIRRPPPELVHKQFAPERGGIIKHKRPQGGEEQRQYMLASVGMMKKFCKGPFKVLSEQDDSKVVGATSSSEAVFNSVQTDTTYNRDEFVLVKFTCPTTPSTKASPEKDELEL